MIKHLNTLTLCYWYISWVRVQVTEEHVCDVGWPLKVILETLIRLGERERRSFPCELMLAKPWGFDIDWLQKPLQCASRGCPHPGPLRCALNANVRPLEQCTVTMAVFQMSYWKWNHVHFL